MSRYLSFVIKNDFHEPTNVEKATEYAEATLPAFQKLVDNKELTPGSGGRFYADEYDEVEKALFVDFPFDIDCDILDAGLRDGFWEFETYFDSYCLPYLGEKVLAVCRYLTSALGQKEAWICVDDHATNSSTRPADFESWIKYAGKFNIIDDLNEEYIKTLTHENNGFKYERFIINGKTEDLSYPIYHINVE